MFCIKNRSKTPENESIFAKAKMAISGERPVVRYCRFRFTGDGGL